MHQWDVTANSIHNDDTNMASAMLDVVLQHCAFAAPGGRWIDPFLATHIEERREPAGTILLAPSLWRGLAFDPLPHTPPAADESSS